MKKVFNCKVIWEVLILLISSLILGSILLNFIVAENSSKLNTHTKCVECIKKHYKENEEEGRNNAAACCTEPEFFLPYLIAKTGSSNKGIALIIIFWFFAILFSKTSARLVERVLKSY